jgi:hypothetical protein
MAKSVITSRYVSINGTDFSASLAGASLEISVNEVDTTSLGSAGWREIAAGIKSGSITLNFMNDYAGASVEATIYPLIGTNATVVMRPASGSVSATNPAYTAIAMISGWAPVSGQVGDLDTQDVTWPVTGAITKATA